MEGGRERFVKDNEAGEGEMSENRRRGDKRGSEVVSGPAWEQHAEPQYIIKHKSSSLTVMIFRSLIKKHFLLE